MMDDVLMNPGRIEINVPINEEERFRILNDHCTRDYDSISFDVDISELVKCTRNFSRSELEALVRGAVSRAMMASITVTNNMVQVDSLANSKLLVCNLHFLDVLKHDIKPYYGVDVDKLEQYLSGGIIAWDTSVSNNLATGRSIIQQLRADNNSGLVSILLEGPPNSGKTTLAAKFAKDSDFPFIKVCSPQDMVGYAETDKCSLIEQIFKDASYSDESCILIDDVERLLDYSPMGSQYSNRTFQTFRNLLNRQTSPGKKLLILCTSSKRQVLEDLGMLTSFTTILQVPNLSTPEHLLDVLEQSQVFSTADVIRIYEQFLERRIFIGIKQLLSLIDMCSHIDENSRATIFMTKLAEDVN